MADARNTEIHRSLRGLFSVGTVAGQSDRELLERFSARRGEAAEFAFAALVERHGPMVMRVCSKILDSHDASDAFQATFLVLARKAGSIYCRDTLGPYLHGVAHRVASGCRSAAARRRRHERGYAERAVTTYVDKPPDDLGRVIHEELGRLPERFRGVAALCDLEGMTYVEAAGRLGCPPGTVMSRLAEARRRLRVRLARRGLASSAGVISATLAAEAKATVLPLALAEATIQAATRFATSPSTSGAIISASVTVLAEGVLRAMFLTKLKTLAMVGLVAGAVATGAGVLAQSPQGRATGPGSVNSAAPGDDPLQPPEKRPSSGVGKPGLPGKSNATSPTAKEPRRPQGTTKTTRVASGKQPHFANAPGCVWLVRPTSFGADSMGGFCIHSKVSYTVADPTVDPTSGSLRILIVHASQGEPFTPGEPSSDFPGLQVVAFDAEGNRYPFKQGNESSEGRIQKGISVWHTSFTLDPKVLALEKVSYLGIEKKPTEPQDQVRVLGDPTH
ncbi:RNA polymerase sigma factor [Singulisphaera sp. Ch08]|uniref:RNA polymerase sigma factor n=1 Tax=Singulisphaera sp. Ch08 TaxID=3120278 RepID=A0AAU7CLJ6_9BACT